MPTQRKLYPGIPFSPPAILTDNIGAADTIIKVSDVSAFPPAPNYATIGTDENGETISYAAKTAEALSGCVRGVEGTAKAWSAGELIARNFTAADHDALIEAVKDAQQGVDDLNAEKAEPGGIATLDENGLVAEAQRAIRDDADPSAKYVLGVEDGKLYIKEAASNA